MLKIQRASAGSGKTYTLAKMFIFHLMAYKTEEGKWVLRNSKQIEDALSHIIAITFTNKATNEMKERIIKNLSLLSNASVKKNLRPAFINEIPYLSDLQEATGRTYEEIGNTAEIALRVLLNNYSLFKISTIDSFFQEMLRTFAYEVNLNNDYQLEIDSDYINNAAISSAMHELDIHPEQMGNAMFWLKIIMEDESNKSQKWNPFNKKESKNSVYSRLKSALTKLESETFKHIRNELDAFFKKEENNDKLISSYASLHSRAVEERKSLFEDIKRSAAKVEYILKNYKYSESFFICSLYDHIRKLKEMTIDGKVPFTFKKVINKKTVFDNKKFPTQNDLLDREAFNLYQLLERWDNRPENDYYTVWKVFGDLIPFLGLMMEIRRFISEVLKKDNLIQLSDTSYILKKIIGEDDTSFVYERLGTRIDHFLIDEFQDTSMMQWDIIKNLLAESVSKGQDCLVIGDPKQSIYRFRNANHTIMTEILPAEFNQNKKEGYSEKNNSNWRSHTNIVKFNNYLFKNLSIELDELSKKKGSSTDFADLYSNVVQYPNNQDGKGYVEIRVFDKPQIDNSSDTLEEDEEKGWFEKRALENLGPLVSELIKRGYNQKDIGILVNTNDKGKSVVEYLISYNNKLGKEEKRIDFISEESLLVSSSPVVEFIVNIIEKLAASGQLYKKNDEGTETEPEDDRRKYYKWSDIKLGFEIFSQQNPGLSLSEKLILFLKEDSFNEALKEFLETLPTPTLSSIVELIVKRFIDESLKKTEAIYIASFQDLINEYSGSHHNDPASFIEWWKTKGCKMSIATPEGIDAVQIMTIHKSKGLEFKCVILPFASEIFVPIWKKFEWRWAKPPIMEGIDLPPFLPLKTTSVLEGTSYQGLYRQYYDQILTDRINMYYVAFTRARNELYVFTKKPYDTKPSLGRFIEKILLKNEGPLNIENENEFLIKKEDLQINEEERGSLITVGRLFTETEISVENLKENNKEKSINYFADYYVNSKRPRLRSKASPVSPSGEFLQDSNH